MKIEKLNYGRNKKILLYGLILGAGLTIGTCFNTSMAKYKVTQSIPIAKGKITNYKVPDLNVVAMYQQGDSGYQEINDVPTNGYTLNTTQSYCGIPDTNGNIVKDNTIPMEYKEGKAYIGVSKKRTKCYLYFDLKTPKNAQELIAAHNIQTRTNFSQVLTTDTTGTIYSAQDNDGETYYFAGAASDNWVKFGKNKDSQDLYWRIIRINGDNTIRLIYAGTNPKVTTGIGTQIGTSKFNANYDNNIYVGYMYMSGSVHGLGTDSTIKGVLDKWYDDNLVTNFGKFVDMNAGFCGDRVPTSGSGTGTTYTEYAPYNRLKNNKTPDFKCTDSNDLYTPVGSNKGNKKLTRPVGLITADEVAFAGGVVGSNNSSYYLYTNQYYWTISPSCFLSSGYADVFIVARDSLGYGFFAVNARDVRPVINLRADTKFSQGNGTADNPYVVE